MANAELILPDILGRHSLSSSVVRVNVQRDGVHKSFSVADQGQDISAEGLPLPFRRFSNVGFPRAGRGHEVGAGHLQGNGGDPRGQHPGQERGALPWGALHLHSALDGGGRERQGRIQPHPRGGGENWRNG